LLLLMNAVVVTNTNERKMAAYKSGIDFLAIV
jgi:hypothetical protein